MFSVRGRKRKVANRLPAIRRLKDERATYMTHRAARTNRCCAPRARLIISLVLCLALLSLTARGAEFLEGFDGPDVSWQVAVSSRTCRVVDHRRHAQIRRFGSGSESIIFDAQKIERAELSHGLSPARILEEPVTATVWLRSNRSGSTLSLRVVYPHLIDPETGKIAFRWLDGETYQTDKKWQMLTCTTSQKELVRRNQLLRAQYGPQSDLRDAYVDRARLSLELGEGATELFIDELKLSPVVSPSMDTPVLPADSPLGDQLPEVKIQHDRLLLDGQAWFLTFLPYHGDPPAELANMGVNLVWIPRHDDRELIDSLQQSGIGVIATPPLATSPNGDVFDAENAGLAPLSEDLDPILFWMLGNEIPASGRRRLANWQKQLLSADRRRQRPLMANVTSGERGFARLVDMLGVNRTVHGTGLDYLHYRDWLADRQMAARPGSFMWTWVDAEPAADLVQRRRAQHLTLPVIEPEQLRSQTYAALSGGMRGIGFWTTQGLFHDAAGAAETRLMLKQLHFEMRLLEPWLATGSPAGQAKFQVMQELNRGGRQPIPAVSLTGPVDTPQISGTLLGSDFGTLLLGTWFEKHSQFTPGQMTANEVQIVVPGIKETAKAWEVTTTEIRPLVTDRNAVPGGTLIRLSQLDVTTAIVISSDLSMGDDLRRRMREIQAESATCIVQLARAKLQRVSGVIDELRALDHAQPDAERMLKRARQLTEQATQHLDKKDFDDARKQGDYALQMLRVLQRAHWDDAVAAMSHPLSSPHTVCFQTLPDHWRMLNRLKGSGEMASANLLHSGNFEDEDTFRTAGWQHSQNQQPGIVAAAELIQPSDRRGYCLRMAAGPVLDKSAPLLLAAAPVTVVTPGVPVQAGQIVRIRGKVKVLRHIAGTRDGFQISDSLAGPSGAIHWHQSGEWQQFDLLREVSATDTLTVTLTVTLTLFGIGEVLVDDLAIQTLDAAPLTDQTQPTIVPATGGR